MTLKPWHLQSVTVSLRVTSSRLNAILIWGNRGLAECAEGYIYYADHIKCDKMDTRVLS